MSWTLYRWIWQLRSPLHVGRVPAGALARTRLYIPAHTFWGALIAELTRRRHAYASSDDYQRMGNALRNETRLSYLFPAEEVDRRWRAWLPEFSREGLIWKREDGGDVLPHRKFRIRLLSTLPATAIDPLTDTVQDGTLRETEVVLPLWKDRQSPVAFAGYVFVKGGKFAEQIQEITELFVGADTRYGLGRLERAMFQDATDFFTRSVDLRADSPKVQTDIVLAHTVVDSGTRMEGDREILGLWNQGLQIQGLCWVPGSRVEENAWFEFLPSGLWRVSQYMK